MNNSVAKFAMIAAVLALAGCEQHYRYPCQDPANWDKAICQAPLCEVNRDCPKYIFENQECKAE